MAWVMPKALLQYQDADAILAARTRKELVEELANALTSYQVAELKSAWKTSRSIHGGRIPAHGEMGTDDMYRLLNSYTVLEKAQVHRKTGNPQDKW